WPTRSAPSSARRCSCATRSGWRRRRPPSSARWTLRWPPALAPPTSAAARARARSARRSPPSSSASAAEAGAALLGRAAGVRSDREIVEPYALGGVRHVARAAATAEADYDPGEQAGQLRVETDNLLGPPAPLGERAGRRGRMVHAHARGTLGEVGRVVPEAERRAALCARRRRDDPALDEGRVAGARRGELEDAIPAMGQLGAV